jgi:hypothetical protein
MAAKPRQVVPDRLCCVVLRAVELKVEQELKLFGQSFRLAVGRIEQVVDTPSMSYVYP